MHIPQTSQEVQPIEPLSFPRFMQTLGDMALVSMQEQLRYCFLLLHAASATEQLQQGPKRHRVPVRCCCWQNNPTPRRGFYDAEVKSSQSIRTRPGIPIHLLETAERNATERSWEPALPLICHLSNHRGISMASGKTPCKLLLQPKLMNSVSG